MPPGRDHSGPGMPRGPLAQDVTHDVNDVSKAGIKEDAGMARTVLLLGVRADLLETVKQELQTPGTEFLSGTGEAEADQALRQAEIDNVIIGGGLDLEARAAMVREVFRSSDRATVHMKDQMSGPEGFLPFTKAVLGGLSSYEPAESPNAILRAGRPRSDAG